MVGIQDSVLASKCSGDIIMNRLVNSIGRTVSVTTVEMKKQVFSKAHDIIAVRTEGDLWS